MTWPLSLLTSGNTTETSPTDEKSGKGKEKSIEHSVLSLLRHYEPGLSIPPSARIGDPKLKQKETVPLKLWQMWKYGAVAASKCELQLTFDFIFWYLVWFDSRNVFVLASPLFALCYCDSVHLVLSIPTFTDWLLLVIDISGAILSHGLRGPPRPSWGIEMTLLSCIMRDVHYHSYLADIVRFSSFLRLSPTLSSFSLINH